MKYFPSTGLGWSASKINFVDENNLVVGFDFGANCCENFGWIISTNPTPPAECVAGLEDGGTAEHINKELEGWVFDPEFFLELREDNKMIEKNYAVFRIINKNRERYLHLYNHHNGYYSHGFRFNEGDKEIKSGYL